MDTSQYIQAIVTLGVIIAVIVITGAVLKKWMAGNGPGLGRGRRAMRRLQLVETMSLDPRRRVVLLRRDGVEHLLLLGGTADLVIETGIPGPQVSPADSAAAIEPPERDLKPDPGPTETLRSEPTLDRPGTRSEKPSSPMGGLHA